MNEREERKRERDKGEMLSFCKWAFLPLIRLASQVAVYHAHNTHTHTTFSRLTFISIQLIFQILYICLSICHCIHTHIYPTHWHWHSHILRRCLEKPDNNKKTGAQVSSGKWKIRLHFVWANEKNSHLSALKTPKNSVFDHLYRSFVKIKSRQERMRFKKE